MLRKLPLLIAITSFSVLAQETNNEYQNIYIAAGYSSHEVLGESGDAFEGYFGARNFDENSFFIGGELEGRDLNNSSLKNSTGIREKYEISANIPIGKRFELSDSVALDAYGLIGSSVLITQASDSFYGVKYGAGIDLNMTNWFVGVRYTRVNSDLDQKDLSLLVGYKLKSLFN